MSKKKSTIEVSEVESDAVTAPVVEIPPTPAPAPKRMARTEWRGWGAPGTDVASGAAVTLPAGTPLEIVALDKDTVVVLHPTTGAPVRVRRGMMALL